VSLLLYQLAVIINEIGALVFILEVASKTTAAVRDSFSIALISSLTKRLQTLHIVISNIVRVSISELAARSSDETMLH